MKKRPTTRFGGLRRTRRSESTTTTTIITLDDDDDNDDVEEEEDQHSHSHSHSHSPPGGGGGGDDAYSHRSCWKHAEAALVSRLERPTKHQLEAIHNLEHTSPCYANTFPHRHRSRLNSKSKFPRLLSTLNKQLNTLVFENCAENLWTSFSGDRTNSFLYISCYWFVMYLEPNCTSKVLTLIKGKQLLSKKYILVPIVRWGHWSLLILCHLGQSSECMLLLDSLHSTEPRRLEPDIRKFVLDIFNVEGKRANKQLVSKIPLLVPKVPQQANAVECGIYVLFFIDLFVQHAPDTFSLDGYPYFMQENWFGQEDVEDFRAKLISLDEAHCSQPPPLTGI